MKDLGLYIGFTKDLKARLIKHASGKVLATMLRRPLKLIYYEAYSNELDARRRREKYLKGGNGKSMLKIQLKEILSGLGYKNL